MKRRGFTLLEMVLALGLTSMVMVGGAQLWQLSVHRVKVERTRALLGIQANDLLESLRPDLENALYCETRTVSGVTSLLCCLPTLGQDINEDGSAEAFTPSGVLSEATLVHEIGSFVWLRPASGPGDWTGTSVLSRLARTRDILPTNIADALDPAFGGTAVPRWTAVQSTSFTVDPLTRRVTVTLELSSRIGDPDLRATSLSGPNVIRTTVTRAYTWRNSR